MSRDFVGGALSFKVTTLLSLGSIGLMELEIMTFVISIPIPIPIPVPRFTNGRLKASQVLRKLFPNQKFKKLSKTSLEYSFTKRNYKIEIEMT